MTDVDERGQSRSKPISHEGQVVFRLKCPECGFVTKITNEVKKELIAKLSKTGPGDFVKLECRCGKLQHILRVRMVKK